MIPRQPRELSGSKINRRQRAATTVAPQIKITFQKDPETAPIVLVFSIHVERLMEGPKDH